MSEARKLRKVTPIYSPACEDAVLRGIDRLPAARCVLVAVLDQNRRYWLEWGGGSVGEQHTITLAVLRATLEAHED